ncbi:DEAD/DEAH box helicase [Marinicrinis lubricantis]|uniref:DEAD/DEAH box helicase n=1 Tax=Marinicrinis lubricantis TaxID=2086470 RepID=A0ABW1IJT3_9BACL
MIAAKSLHIQCDWLPSRQFLLSSDLAADIYKLKNYLFAWHTPSFYGSILDVTEYGRKEGIVLPPEMAVDYFAELPALKHGSFHWSEEIEVLSCAARYFQEFMEKGWYLPDFHRWSQGSFGWRWNVPLERAESFEAIVKQARKIELDCLEEWFHLVVVDRSEQDAALQRIQAEAASMAARYRRNTKPLWLDEEEWLVRIGWNTSKVPFRVALQLTEPMEESAVWQLEMVLQDKQNPSQVYTASVQEEFAAEELPQDWLPEAEQKVISERQKWLQIIPELQHPERASRMIDRLNEEQAWLFLTEWSIRLAEYGCTVYLPKWWEQVRRTKPRIKTKVQSAVPVESNSLFGLEQVMQYDWKIAIGDVDLTEEEFRALLDREARLIQIRGQWVVLSPAMLQSIQHKLKSISKKNGLTFQDILRLELLGGELPEEDDDEGVEVPLEIDLSPGLQAMIGRLQDLEHIPLLPAPESFRGKLRPYQQEGMAWLLFLRQFGFGGCLADDMGLGKTIQWISYLLHIQEQKEDASPSLLIAPTSVLGNWQKELERFAPGLKVHLHYGTHRHRGEAFEMEAQQADVVLTSYNLAHLDQPELSSVEWDCICLDEAQNIKNVYTKQSVAIRKLKGRHRIALTGTPIENRLTELWSIFDFINPGYLGSLREFSRKYVQPIERKQDSQRIHQVQKLVQPFLLRREKKNPAIHLNLPEKEELKCYVSLTAQQGALYEQALQNVFERMDGLSTMERKGAVLALLTRLKQICNHPLLLTREIWPAPEEMIQGSQKLVRMLEMIEVLRAEGERCLIFTQYIDMGRMIQTALQFKLGETARFMHGGVPKQERDEMVAEFQDPESSLGILILSLRTGGTGLNLTAANHVFHFDRWWNPAVENQATDRVYRIGQTRGVQVHKFITLGTLEEKIDEMLESKQGLSDQIIGTGEGWITELSTDELREVLQIRKQWMNEEDDIAEMEKD